MNNDSDRYLYILRPRSLTLAARDIANGKRPLVTPRLSVPIDLDDPRVASRSGMMAPQDMYEITLPRYVTGEKLSTGRRTKSAADVDHIVDHVL
jgi:hypothetical protein